MTSMAEKRAKMIEELKATKERQENGGKKTSGGDNASYRFWDIPHDATAVIRFLPDANDDNPFFWAKREVINLPFDGIINSENDTTDPIKVTVPCMNMWGKTCPILSQTKNWWKTEKEDLARVYWKKISYLYQGFVVTDPLNETDKPENPIRRFVINKSIHDIIEKSLLDPDLDFPVDYENGLDFRIHKGKKGDYADYGASTWARKSRALNQDELNAIDEHKLFNLKEYLGKEPTQEEIDIIEQMFADSLDGKPYDMKKYGNYFKPYITNDNKSSDNKNTKQSATRISSSSSSSETSSKTVEREEVKEETGGSSANKARDIIAELRAKKAAANN